MITFFAVVIQGGDANNAVIGDAFDNNRRILGPCWPMPLAFETLQEEQMSKILKAWIREEGSQKSV